MSIQELLNKISGIRNSSPIQFYQGGKVYGDLNEVAGKIPVDDYVHFMDTEVFENERDNTSVFHYGVLVYDNFDISHMTLIPFKTAYSKEKPQNALDSLNEALGWQQSNVRDFLFNNEKNANAVRNLDCDGYFIFTYDFASQKWSYATNSQNASIELDCFEELYEKQNSVLDIFLKHIFQFNGVNSGKVYTGLKIIDVDIEGRSSSYLLVNTENEKLLRNFMAESQTQLRICVLVSAIRSLYTEIHGSLQRFEATRSAKAAIMARNMSHNIGSHVMSYLKQNLGSVQEMLRTGVLSELVNKNDILQNNDGKSILKKGAKDEVVDNIALPFLMGMGHFISYLQERQDFIATIATDHIPYYSTLNFKDDIYDVLNPDKRVERHAERFSSMATDNILLGNIARSEDLGRVTSSTAGTLYDIVLKFRTSFDGSKPSRGSVAEAELDEMREYNVSLPGGILGRQAVFSIFENIIRNAAKHSNSRGNGNLEFTIDLFTKDEIKNNKIDQDTLNKRLPDDDNEEGCLSMRQVIEKFYLSASDSDDHYFLTITDNRDTTFEKLGKLRCALQDDFVETQGSKGLKEMRISAAWIRSIRNEADCFCPGPEVTKDEFKNACNWEKDGKWKDNPAKPAPLVYARVHGVRSDLEPDVIIQKNLQYIFCIPIPRIVAVISDKLKNTGYGAKSILANLNWRVFSKEEFEKEWNKTFDFILCEDNLYPDVRKIASARTFSFSQAKIDGDKLIDAIKNNAIKKEEAKEYEKSLYRLLAKVGPNDIISIDDKDCNNEAKSGKYYDDKKIKIADGESGDAYVYRRHHESEMEFRSFMSARKAPAFVEGISGGNSTDRLVRHGEWDDIWYYRHLHAMKQQVAVIDERVFPKITGIEAAMSEKSNEVWSDDYQALTYLQKGIFPFTLVAGKDKYYLIGCECAKDSNGRLIPVKNDKYECQCKKLAEITYGENGMEITESYLDRHFDYITIHQGLLDKMYEFFGVRDNSSAKKDITTELFKKWSSQKEDAPYDKDGFHPGFIIHSGRSKPTDNDMPQHLPFIQYAALEHAVADCKFTLVELMDYARYSLYL